MMPLGVGTTSRPYDVSHGCSSPEHTIPPPRVRAAGVGNRRCRRRGHRHGRWRTWRVRARGAVGQRRIQSACATRHLCRPIGQRRVGSAISRPAHHLGAGQPVRGHPAGQRRTRGHQRQDRQRPRVFRLGLRRFLPRRLYAAGHQPAPGAAPRGQPQERTAREHQPPPARVLRLAEGQSG